MQSTEHVHDLRKLILNISVVGVLLGNGILTLLNRVSKVMKAGTVGHGKRRRWREKKKIGASRRQQEEEPDGSNTKCREHMGCLKDLKERKGKLTKTFY
jgi:hypothetical protein